jgi:hypothetical protein
VGAWNWDDDGPDDEWVRDYRSRIADIRNGDPLSAGDQKKAEAYRRRLQRNGQYDELNALAVQERLAQVRGGATVRAQEGQQRLEEYSQQSKARALASKQRGDALRLSSEQAYQQLANTLSAGRDAFLASRGMPTWRK